MGDFGLKISETGKDVNTSSLSDTSFDSRYASFMLLEKKTIEWTVDQGETNPSGTETYTHNLGYFPFIIGYASFATQSENYPALHTSYILPLGVSVATRGGTNLTVNIMPDIEAADIVLHWDIIEAVAGTPVALTDDVDITVVLHIYAYELGYETD